MNPSKQIYLLPRFAGEVGPSSSRMFGWPAQLGEE